MNVIYVSNVLDFDTNANEFIASMRKSHGIYTFISLTTCYDDLLQKSVQKIKNIVPEGQSFAYATQLITHTFYVVDVIRNEK